MVAGSDLALFSATAAAAAASAHRGEEDRVGDLVQEAAHHRERVEESRRLQLAYKRKDPFFRRIISFCSVK